MSRRLSLMALDGRPPAFDTPVPVGQLYFPSWERYRAAMAGVWERGWFTNHGPLVQELEQRLATFLGVRHAICCTNATVGLTMLMRCLGIRGRIAIPAFTFIATAQAARWAGLEPVLLDVDPETHMMGPAQLQPLDDAVPAAVAGVDLWGGACDSIGLAAWAQARGVPCILDSAQAMGVCRAADSVPRVFSLHATKVLSATEGGCVATDDDDLAALLRNMRSSYGAGAPVAVPVTANGRMSEAQAAVGLMSLQDLPTNISRNQQLHAAYMEALRDIPGVETLQPTGAYRSNWAYLVCRIDSVAFGLPRDGLVRFLHSHNVLARRYFYPGVHRSVPFIGAAAAETLPATEALSACLVQLPLGARTDNAVVNRVAQLVHDAHRLAPQLRQALQGAA